MSYFKLQFFLVVILLTLCFDPTLSAGEILEYQEQQGSGEFENVPVDCVRKDYGNGFVDFVNFVNTMNNTVTNLQRDVKNLISKISDQESEFASLKAIITNQQKEIVEFKDSVRKLHKLKTNLSWVEFDELTRGIQTEIKTGNSFNGSTLSEIKSRASQVGQHGIFFVVVVVNYLDEEIHDFTMFDSILDDTEVSAPKSIPPHTQEMFTFVKSTWLLVDTSFSYAIPFAGARVAAITGIHGVTGISIGNEFAAGLAFVSNDASMEIYSGTKKGIEGSWVYEERSWTDKNKNLSVSYKNLQARMFAEYEDQVTLRIELIKLPL